MAANFLTLLMSICDDASIENLLCSNLLNYHEKELLEKICNTIEY